MKVNSINPVKNNPSVFLTNGDVAGIKAKEANVSVQESNEAPVVHKPATLFTVPPPLFSLFDVAPGADSDLDRYNDILKGKARKELQKFRNPQEIIGKKGKDIVSIPVPIIEIPRFTRGRADGFGGVGSGDGEEGDIIDSDGEPGPGPGAGDKPGEHIKEIYVPMTRSDVAKLFMEDLGLPRLQPKGYGGVKEKQIKWNTLSRVGKELDLKRTVLNAISRLAAEKGEEIDIENEEQLEKFLDSVVIEEVDKVFNSYQIVEKPQASAVIFYMMDVSGSMGEEQKEMVRTLAWYLSTIIQYQFGQIRAELRGEEYSHEQFGEGIDEVFIIHDSEAAEVDEETFYTTRESGGTRISSAYRLVQDIIKQRYNPALWNIYMFHFSDGDNWGEDNEDTMGIIKELAKIANEIGYVQTKSPYGSGEFKDVLSDSIQGQYPHVRISEIEEPEQEQYKKVVIDMLQEDDEK